MSSQSRRLSSVLVGLLLALAACDGGGEAVDIGGGEDTAEGGQGGVLIAAISGEPDQLDPHKTTAYPSFQVLENVYDTLVQPNVDLEFEPALAESWEVSDDGLVWTFHLREGVEFHDGSPFTADDVVFSYNRIIDEELANAYRFGTVEEVRAVDDHTVEIEVSEPTPNLLANIGAFKGVAIVSEEATTGGDIQREPVGTGPFQFVDHVQGRSIALEANEDYWGEGPDLEGVEFRFISEPTVAMTNLETGEVHWTDNVPPQQIEQLKAEDDIVVESVPSTDYWYFATNLEREPFDDPRVRQALAFGIDREAVTAAAKFDAATVNQTAIPEGSFWYFDHGPYEHDPERARQLLEEAGVDDLSFEMMVTDEFPETIQAAQVMASQLAEIGVDMEIRTLDFATWLDEQGQGNFDAFMLGWLGNIDPHDFYYAQHHSEGNFNFHGYSNPQVDELLDAGRTETDPEARKEIYDQAADIIVDEASYVYLYNPDVVHAWLPILEGYEPRVDRAIRFEDVSLEE
jgi:peptide/nickel transport system substrate-binding protein